MARRRTAGATLLGSTLCLGVIAGLTGACSLVATFLGPPSVDDLETPIRMVEANVPADAPCLNTETKGPRAMELLHPLKRKVVIHGGENQITMAEWKEFDPPLPWMKNQEIQNLYESHCHYRSPGAPVDCNGWECARYDEVEGYTWRILGNLRALGCYPEGSGGCEQTNAEPKHLAVILVEKCHVVRVKSPTYELTDTKGNKFVMNAHSGPKPVTDVALPDGWRMDVVERDKPLEIKPFGGGDSCFHVVLNDSEKQFYHQFYDADGVFP